MSFIEVEFFYFAPVVFVLHWLLPPRPRWQNVFLVITSAVFYAASSWKLYALLFSGATLDYCIVQYIEKLTGNREKQPLRRTALLLSLVVSLGSLAYFKYCGFFVDSVIQLLNSVGIGAGRNIALHVLLPLGISFYTLQRVGAVLDVYWERATIRESYLEFLLFSSFFPQLTAGPISRCSELLSQLGKPRYLTVGNVADAAGAFFMGYILKGLVAEHIGSYWVDPVFAASAEYNRLSHLVAVVGYAAQVFSDFAGYSLMAIGVAKFFGIDLPVNFNFPFLSRSLPELWRRWHITLNRWLFDYIFTPLTTSRTWFRGRLDAALMMTFIASGIWHGAAWTFVLWGLMHGIGMVVQRNWDERYRQLCRKDKKYVSIRKSAGYSAAAWALTIGFFIASLLPFRAPTAKAAGRFVREIFSQSGTQSVHIGALTLLCFSVVVAYHVLELAAFRRVRDGFFRLPSPVRGVVYGLVVAFLLLKVPTGTGTFIYQQF